MKTINPKFPKQQSIDTALTNLSPEKLTVYEELKEQYEQEINSAAPNHETLSSIMKEASDLLTPYNSIIVLPHSHR